MKLNIILICYNLFQFINWYFDSNILLWYYKISSNNYFFSLVVKHEFNLIKNLYCLQLYNYFFFLWLNMIKFFNFVIDLNHLLYFKLNIQEFYKYFIKYLQNFQIKLLYFKSNYYYFKKQKLIRRYKREVPLLSFFSTNLKRNWFALKPRTSNFFNFFNIYTLNNKMFFFKQFDISLNSFFF